MNIIEEFEKLIGKTVWFEDQWNNGPIICGKVVNISYNGIEVESEDTFYNLGYSEIFLTKERCERSIDRKSSIN